MNPATTTSLFSYHDQPEHLTAMLKRLLWPLCIYSASGSGTTQRIQVLIWFGLIPIMKLTSCNWHRHTGNLISSSCCLRAFDHGNFIICFMYLAPPIGEQGKYNSRRKINFPTHWLTLCLEFSHWAKSNTYPTGLFFWTTHTHTHQLIHRIIYEEKKPHGAFENPNYCYWFCHALHC